MQYQHRKEVLPKLQEKSKKEIDAVNRYIDSLQGTIVSIERIRSGQSRLVCTITREEAKVLIRMFVGSWEEKPLYSKWAFESRLELLEPAPNPCGLEEYKDRSKPDGDRASCWRVVIRHPYTD